MNFNPISLPHWVFNVKIKKKLCFFGAAPPSTHPPEGFSLNVGNGLLCKLMQLGIHQQEQDMDRWIVVWPFCKRSIWKWEIQLIQPAHHAFPSMLWFLILLI